eukprot:251855-Chlamydomonas_euryale.AAC.1
MSVASMHTSANAAATDIPWRTCAPRACSPRVPTARAGQGAVQENRRQGSPHAQAVPRQAGEARGV